MKSPRQAAFEVLLKVEGEKAYSNIATNEMLNQCGFDKRDSALACMLINGVLERLYTLDYALSANLKKPIKRLEPKVLTILRLGAYQLLFTDRIPNAAAVNESVRLARKNGCSYAAGLINGTLRAVSDKKIVYPLYDDNKEEFYRVKYSFPLAFIRLLCDSYGEETAEEFMSSSLNRSETIYRINTIKVNRTELVDILKSEGAEPEFLDFPSTAFIIKNGIRLSESKAFSDGLFYAQDTASQLCAMALEAEDGNRVIDVCSAPGGKSFSLACIMHNKGEILSCDIHEHKLKLIEASAKKLGIDIISTCLADAADPAVSHDMADRVLCDVPCSGLGAISKKPEIKYKDLKQFADLPKLQLKILENSSRFVKSNGILVYSTCTINPAENGEVVSQFLDCHPEFEAVSVLPQAYGNRTELTLMPHTDNCDGFYIAKLKRRQ